MWNDLFQIKLDNYCPEKNLSIKIIIKTTENIQISGVFGFPDTKKNLLALVFCQINNKWWEISMAIVRK